MFNEIKKEVREAQKARSLHISLKKMGDFATKPPINEGIMETHERKVRTIIISVSPFRTLEKKLGGSPGQEPPNKGLKH